MRRLFYSLCTPLCAASVLLLGAAALGLRPGMGLLARHFEKHGLSLRRSLHELGRAALPSFETATLDVDALIRQVEIGTGEFACVSVRSKSAPGDAAPVALLVTYYADPHDPVPHTPETCFGQAGAVVTKQWMVYLSIPELGSTGAAIPVQVLRFRGGVAGEQLVAYLFDVSGSFCTDRLQVRSRLRWPGDRGAYFSKIEVWAPCRSEADEPTALATCVQLLRETLPVLVREYFPDKAALKQP